MRLQISWNAVTAYREQLPNSLEAIPTTFVSKPTV